MNPIFINYEQLARNARQSAIFMGCIVKNAVFIGLRAYGIKNIR
jgi:hypothetical protein